MHVMVVMSVHEDACRSCCGGEAYRGSVCECCHCASETPWLWEVWRCTLRERSVVIDDGGGDECGDEWRSCCGGEAYRGPFASADAVRFCCGDGIYVVAAGVSDGVSSEHMTCPCHSHIVECQSIGPHLSKPRVDLLAC